MTSVHAGAEPETVDTLVHCEAVTAAPKDSLAAVAKKLGGLGIGMVVIMDDGSVAGVVSERDIVWAIANDADLDEVWAADVMSDQLVSVEPTTPIADAAKQMVEQNVRHLLVLYGEKPGVISLRDVVEHLVE